MTTSDKGESCDENTQLASRQLNAPLKVTANLIRLERDGRLLLLNSLQPRPLLFRRGREFVSALLASCGPGLLCRDELVALWPEETAVIDFLISHHIRVDTTESELAPPAAKPSAEELMAPAPGMSLYLLLSQDCNLGCIYCLNGKRTYRKSEQPMMPEAVAFAAVERCAARIKPGAFLEIAMFGGEPLLNWELAKRTIDYAEAVLKPRHPDIEFRYHVTSNLSFLPEDFIARVKAHGITVLCDIDGVGDVHDACRPYKGGAGSHAAIAANVKTLTEAGIPVCLRTTITALNQDQMAETARHHFALGGNGTAFVPVNVVNFDEDLLPDELIPDVDRLLDALLDVQATGDWALERLFPFSTFRSKIQPGNYCVLGCGAPFGNTPVVDVNGDVYPCIYLVGIKRYNQGNVLSGSYPDPAVALRLVEELHVDQREDCKGCSWRYLCGGGCPVQMLAMAGRSDLSPKAQDYCERINCEYTKKVLEVLLWEYAEQAERLADGCETAPERCSGPEAKYC